MNAPDADPKQPAEDQLLYNLALGVAGVSGANLFESIVRYLAASLGVDVAFVGRLLPSQPTHVQTVAVCLDGNISDNLKYDLSKSPCREVVGQSCYYVRDGVEKKYAGDNMLGTLGLTGYAGAPLNDSKGHPLGVIAVLHRGPLPDQRLVETVLSIFAARAATELERLAAEEALRTSEERYHTIFNASVDGIALCTPDGRVMEANPAFCRLFGATREELLAADSFQFVHPDSQTHCWAFFLAASAGQSLQAEARAQRRDGSFFDTEVHGVPVHYGNEPHLLLIMRNITERKQAEAERAQLETQLRQAQKMEAIGHLAGGIAHDFNNILTSLMGYVTMVAESLEERGDARLTRYLERAGQSGQRARDLIQQLLTFSRGQRGEPRPLFLAPLINEAVKLLAASLPSSIELGTELEENLPPVLLDPVQLEQVLMNLCINASDAMAGRGRLRISLRRADEHEGACASCHQSVAGPHVELAVSDEGPGIAADVMERMFEPFYTTKEVGKGSGMGLATVHGIVHEHGGHIVVDSTPGRGASFRVLFPPLKRAPAVEPAPASETVRPSRRAQLHGRVLLVDDEPAVAEFMQDLLGDWGLTVTAMSRSTAARDAFAHNPHAFDIALLDQTMPGLTGLELAQDILLLRPELPVVLYTGYREALDDEAVKKVGVRAVVRKPVDVAQLHALFEVLLSRPA